MKTATLNKGFAAFLGLVLIGVGTAIVFTTPAPSSHAASGHPLPGAAMDGGYESVEPASAPVVEARLLTDSEVIAGEPAAAEATADTAASAANTAL